MTLATCPAGVVCDTLWLRIAINSLYVEFLPDKLEGHGPLLGDIPKGVRASGVCITTIPAYATVEQRKLHVLM